MRLQSTKRFECYFHITHIFSRRKLRMPFLPLPNLHRTAWYEKPVLAIGLWLRLLLAKGGILVGLWPGLGRVDPFCCGEKKNVALCAMNESRST